MTVASSSSNLSSPAALAVCRRDGSVLSAIWRDMWDGERLQNRVRKKGRQPWSTGHTLACSPM